MATTITENKDISYILKDFSSSVDSMIAYSNVQFGPGTEANKLWTNFNESSFSRVWLELIALISDTFFFYFDVQSTQSYLQTASIRSAVHDIAAQFGFQPATEQSASGDATFTFSGPGTISRGFRTSSISGLEFFVTNDITAGIAGDFTGTVLQGIIKTENNSSKGLQNEEFELAGPNVIIDLDNINTTDITPQVTVNGNSYTLVESFLRFNGTDTPAITDSLGNTIGGGGRVFTIHERPDGVPFIRFGDGIFGRKLLPGESVIVTYRTGGGSQGNIAKESLNTLVDTLPFVTGVVNNDDFSGGSDEQSIEQLRQLIPASLRTLERAVAEQDYSDIIIANFSEVFAASTEQNNVDTGVDINIYVVPQGSGITAITTNTLLLNSLTDFIDRRKMVTVQFQILDAFSIDTVITLEVFIVDSASKTAVSEAITTAITDFFDLNTGGSDGSGIGFAEPILLKDICNLMDDIDGVDRFEIKRLTYKPRIEQNSQGLVTDYNFSDVTIFPPVSESEWLLGASGLKAETAGEVLFSNPDAEGFSYASSTGTITYDFPVDLKGVAPGDSFRNGPGLEEETTVQTVGDGIGTEEVTKVTTVADEQGIQEETELTARADVASDLGGTFFLIYDLAGSVAVWFNVDAGNTQPSSGANRSLTVAISAGDADTVVAAAIQSVLDGDSQFSASVASEVVTVTSATKLDITDASDGAVPTDFSFNVTIQGVNPDTLSGSYFDLEDDTGPVRVWFDVDNGSSAPSVPGGGRLLEVDIVANDSAVAAATALQSVVDGDSKFSAAITNNEVDITDASVGTRTNVSDGAPPTGFTFEVTTEGADAVTLGGKSFDVSDDSGPVRIWFDIDNLSSAPSTPAGGRLLEVDISAADIDTVVASALQVIVDGDSKFSATVFTNTVTITDATIGTRINAIDVDSGFTINTTVEGIENDIDFLILGVDIELSQIHLLEDQPVNPVGALDAGGSIRNGNTFFQSFKAFKKTNAVATNLSLDSITDNNIDFSVQTGTGTALAARLLIDNTNVFVPDQYSTGLFFLVDGSGNIWEITDNDSNTLTVGSTSVNDAAITSVASGDYKIVTKLVGSQITFNGSIFNIQYNSENTMYSLGSQFTQIGTIGDDFQISTEQDNVGNLGVAVDPISFDVSTGELVLNGSPNLVGIDTNNVLLDSSGQLFNVVAVDNRALPSVFYDDFNQDVELILEGSALGSQYAEGFQVTETNIYSVVSFDLRREGNIIGNLTARIVNDDGSGLPDSSSVVAVSSSLNVTEVTDGAASKVVFSFANPPTLNAGLTYHIILSGDTAYSAAQQDNATIFTNPAVGYTYNVVSGLVEYAAAVDLSSVLPGQFFEDETNTLFTILAVNDTNDTILIDVGLTVTVGSTEGNVLAKDNILLSADSSTPTFTSGELSRFNGTLWSNSSTGPDQFGSLHVAVFSVEGPKSIKIDSNLTPILGPGATISKRYYDDEDEISVIVGISNGVVTAAADVNANGTGTVGGSPNSTVDNFVFRTSRFSDDIVNLRAMEIPQIQIADILINVFGGIA